MKPISLLLISTLQAARIMQQITTECSDKIKFDEVELYFNENEMAYTNGGTKLAQNPADKTWMFVSPENDPLVSFDKRECVDDNMNWFQLDMSVFEYKPISVSIDKL